MLNEREYREIIRNLFAELQSKYGSTARAATACNVSKYNLSKIATFKQDISVGLYLLLWESLQNKPLRPERNALNSIGLREYLSYDHHKITTITIKLSLC